MIYAGTGHRPHKLGGYGEDVAKRLFDLAAGFLAHHEVSWAISGMAVGWDMAVAEAATALHIPWTAAIPFVGQESKWPVESQTRYQFMLTFAAEKVIVCEGGYEPWKMIKRDEWMVDHSDCMLALWNGSGGGTGKTLAYAEKVRKPIINLWDEWEQSKLK